MTDPITSEERAAIDAAIEAGMVVKVAPGESGYTIEYNENTGRLRYADTGAGNNFYKSSAVGRRNIKRSRAKPDTPRVLPAQFRLSPKIVSQVERIKAMSGKGLNRTEARRQMPELTARQFAYALLKSKVVFAPAPCPVEERHARLAEMVANGKLTKKTICKVLEISTHTLAADLDAIGKALPRAAHSRPDTLASDVMSQRRQKIKALIARGCTREELLSQTGFSWSTIRTDLAVLGLKAATKKTRAMNSKMAAQREQISALCAQGMTLPEIAKALDRESKATRSLMHRMGLRAKPAPNNTNRWPKSTKR